MITDFEEYTEPITDREIELAEGILDFILTLKGESSAMKSKDLQNWFYIPPSFKIFKYAFKLCNV